MGLALRFECQELHGWVFGMGRIYWDDCNEYDQWWRRLFTDQTRLGLVHRHIGRWLFVYLLDGIAIYQEWTPYSTSNRSDGIDDPATEY